MKIKTKQQMYVAIFFTTVVSVFLSILVTYITVGEARFAYGIIPATIAPLVVAPIVSYLGFSQNLRIHHLNEQLTKLVNYDTLTQVCSRSFFFDEATRDNSTENAAALVIDADNFKSINDTFGHAIGDVALVHLSKIIQRSCRKTDVVARLGGEEFGVYMTETDYQTALIIAERIRFAVQENPLYVEGNEIEMSVSIGLAERQCNDTVTSLVRRADAALYKAKEAGRNRVCFASFSNSDGSVEVAKFAAA